MDKNTLTLTIEEAKSILDTASEFHLGAEKVLRYVGDPYVEGDNVAEHAARAIRMAIYSMPFILKEFPEEKDLAEDIYSTILLHDDDEIVQGYDVITMLKDHGTHDQEEIEALNQKMSALPPGSREYALTRFASYRQRNSLSAKMAKSFDNLTGNQLVFEQKLGLVAPNMAKFGLNYIEQTRGASKTTDLLIEAQKEKILEYRKLAKNNEKELDDLADRAGAQKGCKLSKQELKELINSLLGIDIVSHQIEKSKILAKIWEYQS